MCDSLVGNKCDLSPAVREVSEEEGRAKAKSWRCPFVETSAKTATNISKVFEECARAVESHKMSSGGGPCGNAKASSDTSSSSKKKKSGCLIL